MNLQKQMLTMETKAKLSTLWMFYLFNRYFGIFMNLLSLDLLKRR